MQKLERVYENRLSRHFDRIGIDKVVRFFYRRLSLHLSRMRFVVKNRSVDGTYIATLGDSTAKYEFTNERERKSLVNFTSNTHEGESILTLLGTIESDDVFFDIGSNIGHYSCFIGQSVDDGNVYCFEPHPMTAERAEENLEKNGIEANVFNIGISETDGEMEFCLRYTHDVPGGFLKTRFDYREKRRLSVSVRSIDSHERSGKVPQPTIIKIDIDGEDVPAVRGAENTIRNEDCHTVILEIHPDSIEERGVGSVEEIMGIFNDAGFTKEYLEAKAESSAYLVKFEKERV